MFNVQHDGAYRSEFFAPAPVAEPKPPFTPTFRKGQKLLTKEGTEFSLKRGDVVTASVDSFLSTAGNEILRLEGHSFKVFYVSHFEAIPERKNFLEGQSLVVLDASSSNNLLKEGETVIAAADAFIGSEGREIVFARSVKTGKAGTFHTTRFALAPEQAKPAFNPPNTLYYSEYSGYTADIYELLEGDEVAVYQLVKTGKAKASVE